MTDQKKIFKAMSDVMATVGAISKDQRNKTQGFNFRGIDQVYNALNRAMSRAGVFTTSEVISHNMSERTTSKGSVLITVAMQMRYTFYAEDGSNVTTEVVGEGMDSGDKATNKAMAIAHKYALLQAFCVPTEDMADPDADSYEAAPEMTKEQRRVVAIITKDATDAQIKQDIRVLWDRAKAAGVLKHVGHALQKRAAELPEEPPEEQDTPEAPDAGD